MTNMESNEIDLLKSRADLMGISYHPSIGALKLKEKINAVLTKDTPPEPVEVSVGGSSEDEESLMKKAYIAETPAQRSNRLRKDAHRLIRVRITCMNPNKKSWQGEVFDVGNSVIGMTKKFVPYNIESESGYHIPNIIYKHLKDRQFQMFVKTKLPNGRTKKVGKLAKEFAIEVLDPLTETELKELAAQQALNHSID